MQLEVKPDSPEATSLREHNPDRRNSSY